MAIASVIRTVWIRTAVVGGAPARARAVAFWLLLRAEDRVVDRVRYRWRGVETSGRAFDDRLDGDSLGYVPSPWRSLRRLLSPSDFSPSDVLLEYGSGKGRTEIWLVSQCRIKQIIGVEIQEELIAVAQANLSSWTGPRRTTELSFTQCDASEYLVPDAVTVVYLFNPFLGDTFVRMVAQLVASLERVPRQMRIIYQFPVMHDSLIAAGFELTQLHRHIFNAWATYSWTEKGNEG